MLKIIFWGVILIVFSSLAPSCVPAPAPVGPDMSQVESTISVPGAAATVTVPAMPAGATPIDETISAASIDSLEEITLGGVEQWILLQGSDITNPILLVLHGGPGYAIMPLFHECTPGLEDHFTVVNWDQRGAGLSWAPAISIESMTLDQFISDAHQLTAALKDRFNQEKIYLLGHSLGTVFGMLLIDEYPQDYHAFVGVGQVVDIIENEQLGYDFALREAKVSGDTDAIRQLERVGRPDEDGFYLDDSGYEVTASWVGYYGGDLYGKTSTDEIEEFLLSSDIYADDGWRLEKGWEFSQVLFNDETLWHLDFRSQAREVDVPVFFFAGRHDYDTPSELVEGYFYALGAPYKEMVWFEDSAHFPFYEESDRFVDMMVTKVLGGGDASGSRMPDTSFAHGRYHLAGSGFYVISGIITR